MTDADVSALLRQAVQTSDPAVMRHAIERLTARGADAMAADAVYETRHEDYVMEMPQSGERIRGRDAMRSMEQHFPDPPTVSVRRVVGAQGTWMLEAVNDYGGGDIWHAVVVLELDPDGRILRDTRYYAKPFDPPNWRAAWVEQMS